MVPMVAHGGRADCKGAQEAFSLTAGRSDDETTLGSNFFGLAQNKHERAVSTRQTFTKNILGTQPAQPPWNVIKDTYLLARTLR